jgi:hypothetical protein
VPGLMPRAHSKLPIIVAGAVSERIEMGSRGREIATIVKAVASRFRTSITRAQFICVAISQCLGRAKQKIQTIIGTRNALGDKKQL